MKTVFKCVFGSHMYGLDTENSDMDYKSVFIPNTQNLVLQRAINNINTSTGGSDSRNTKDDVDEEKISLHKFIDDCLSGQTYCIDMLHCNTNQIIETSEVWDFIQSHRHMFYSTDMKSYMGYVKKQAAKYGIKGTRLDALSNSITEANEALCISNAYDGEIDIDTIRLEKIMQYLPEDRYRKKVTVEKNGITSSFYQVLEKKYQTTLRVTEYISALEEQYNKYGDRAKQAQSNNSVDWKAVSHAVRGGLQLREIYTTGDLKYPLKDRELLLKIKLGQLDFETEVKPVLEQIVDEVDQLAIKLEESGELPDKPDRKFWDDFVYRVYGGEIVTNWHNENEGSGKIVAEGFRTRTLKCEHDFVDDEMGLDWFAPTMTCKKRGQIAEKSS